MKNILALLFLMALQTVGVYADNKSDADLLYETYMTTSDPAGSRTYAQAASTFYGTQFADILNAKSKLWTADMFTDYRRSSAPVSLRKIRGGAMKTVYGVGNVMVQRGAYFPHSNIFFLAEDEPVAVVHEIGHSMQRRKLMASGIRDVDTLDPKLKAAYDRWPNNAGRRGFYGADAMIYCTSRPEWEVRLQALNRFYFQQTGTAIMTEADAVRALSMLYIRPSYGKIQEHTGLGESAFVEARRAKGHTLAEIEDWHNQDLIDLKQVFVSADQFSRETFQRLYGMVLREAPKHL